MRRGEDMDRSGKKQQIVTGQSGLDQGTCVGMYVGYPSEFVPESVACPVNELCTR
jgi:hypothetical protein